MRNMDVNRLGGTSKVNGINNVKNTEKIEKKPGDIQIKMTGIYHNGQNQVVAPEIEIPDSIFNKFAGVREPEYYRPVISDTQKFYDAISDENINSTDKNSNKVLDEEEQIFA